MWFWAGQLVGTPVEWYWSLPGAEPVPWPSQFYSSNWDDDLTERTVGERTGNHSYRKGVIAAPLPGNHLCGDERWWRNGGIYGVTPPITVDSLGLSPCCSPLERSAVLDTGSDLAVSVQVAPSGPAVYETGSDLAVTVIGPVYGESDYSGGADWTVQDRSPRYGESDFSGGSDIAVTVIGPVYGESDFSGGSDIAVTVIGPVYGESDFSGGSDIAVTVIGPVYGESDFSGGADL